MRILHKVLFYLETYDITAVHTSIDMNWDNELPSTFGRAQMPWWSSLEKAQTDLHRDTYVLKKNSVKESQETE